MENEHIKIAFSDPINTATIKNFIENLEKMCLEYPKAKSLIINISSPGGDVNVAIELFHFLRELDCKIQTINTSYVNSAAVLIYLAGDVRSCYPGSTFYIHSISKRLKGNYDAKSLLREAKEINVNTDIVTSLLERRTSRSKRYWRKLMTQGHILKAEQAVDTGLATYIINNHHAL